MPSLPNRTSMPPPIGSLHSRLGYPELAVVKRRAQPELPFVPRLWKRLDWGRAVQSSAFVALELTGWAVGTMLFLLGGIVVLVLVLSHGQLDVFFAQVDNFGSRIVSADAARRLVLEHELVQGLTLATLTLGALRLPSLIRALRRELRSKVEAA